MLWAFVAITVPLVLIPGAATTVVLRNAVAGGTRAGLLAAVGTNTANACYGLLTAFGFAIALQRWPAAWRVVHVAGIVYLAWLGVKSLRHAMAPRPPIVLPLEPAGAAHRHLLEGFTANALNPPVATFYFIVVPQFVPPGAPATAHILLLTAVHVGLAFTCHAAWALAGGTLAATLSGGRPRQALEAIAGVALIAMALRMAVGR